MSRWPLTILLLALAACGGAPADEPLGTLKAKATADEILDVKSSYVEIEYTATAPDGKPGEGWVVVEADFGNLGEVGLPETTLTLANGKATLQYSCDYVRASDCPGSRRILASWKGASLTTQMRVRNTH